jgi:hypothetical protein
MAGVEHAADLLVVLRLRAEQGVDLVVEDRRQAIGVGHLAEQVSRGRVDGLDRPGHEQLGNLEGPRLPRAGLG